MATWIIFHSHGPVLSCFLLDQVAVVWPSEILWDPKVTMGFNTTILYTTMIYIILDDLRGSFMTSPFGNLETSHRIIDVPKSHWLVDE
jgi:hypothetical protein